MVVGSAHSVHDDVATAVDALASRRCALPYRCIHRPGIARLEALLVGSAVVGMGQDLDVAPVDHHRVAGLELEELDV